MPPKKKNGRGRGRGSTKGYVLGKKQAEKPGKDHQLSFYDPKCKYHMKEKTLNIDPMYTYSLQMSQMTWEKSEKYIFHPKNREKPPKIHEKPPNILEKLPENHQKNAKKTMKKKTVK